MIGRLILSLDGLRPGRAAPTGGKIVARIATDAVRPIPRGSVQTAKEDAMKKKPILKITLNRETLLRLEHGDLERAAAGRLTDFVTCYVTCLRTCQGCTV